MVQTCNGGAAARIKPAPSHEDSNWWADKHPSLSMPRCARGAGRAERCSGTVLVGLRTIGALSIAGRDPLLRPADSVLVEAHCECHVADER
jgi:hypothetical protein